MGVRKQLVALLGKEFELQADEDKGCINPVVAENIDFRKPLEGEVIYRLRQLAKERNINYQPSQDAMTALCQYLDFKGLSDPMDETGGAPKVIPQPVYNPQQDNNNNQFPPPNFPPGGGPGGNVMIPPPGYNPQQQMPMMPPQAYNQSFPQVPPQG